MFVVIASWLLAKNVRGMALYPFILLKSKSLKTNKIIVNHEKIHLRQQIEFLILPFYLWYLIEFLVRWIQFKEIERAYLNISFEREAYTNEKNLTYLKKRKFWAFFNYL